jgi:hypothetical protein
MSTDCQQSDSEHVSNCVNVTINVWLEVERGLKGAQRECTNRLFELDLILIYFY